MRKFYYNATIKAKITLGFYVIIFFSVLIALTGIVSLFNISNKYSNLLDGANYRSKQVSESRIITNDLRRALNTIVVQDNLFNSAENVNAELEQIQKNLAKLDEHLTNYKGSLDKDTSSTELIIENGKLATDDIVYLIKEELNPVITEFKNAIEKKDRRTVSECINKSTLITDDMNTVYTYLSDLSDATIDMITENIESTKTTELIIVIVILIIVILLSFVMSTVTSREIYLPIFDLSKKASMIAKGNFDVSIKANRNDEIGKLRKDVSSMVDVMNSLIYDINNLSENMEDGNLSAIIDTSKYDGSFKETAESVNGLAKTLINDLSTVSDCVESYSVGDFSKKCPDMAGEKAVFNNTLNTMKEYFENMSVDINQLVNNAKNGILGEQIDTSTYKGSWKDLVENFNELILAIEEPVDAVSNSIEQIINGNLNVSVKNNYSGKFGRMVDDINGMSKTLSSVVYEISDILTKMSEGNFDVSSSQDYRGEFSAIKNALDGIISNFNKLFVEISNSSVSILNSSEVVAQASESLAQGTSKQSYAVSELTNTANELANRIKANGESTSLMEELVSDAIKQTEKGNLEIDRMTEAMEAINTASESISHIILVIDEIAFQTNILALNASVEAARAGSAGQGFAVVADEVRNLAGRSQKAAQESSNLINTSREKVENGMEIAKSTFEVLKLISEKITKISELSRNIDESSKIQNDSVNKISDNINEINQVVSVYSENSEKSAQTSEELKTKARAFREMINIFNVKEG